MYDGWILTAGNLCRGKGFIPAIAGSNPAVRPRAYRQLVWMEYDLLIGMLKSSIADFLQKPNCLSSLLSLRTGSEKPALSGIGYRYYMTKARRTRSAFEMNN